MVTVVIKLYETFNNILLNVVKKSTLTVEIQDLLTINNVQMYDLSCNSKHLPEFTLADYQIIPPTLFYSKH